MPNRLVVINMPRFRQAEANRLLDGGQFLDALAERSLSVVIATRQTFENGSATAPIIHPGSNRISYVPTRVEAGEIAVVRNHAVKPSICDRLSVPVLNSGQVRQAARSSQMQEAISGDLVPESEQLSFPAGVEAKTSAGQAILNGDPGKSRLRSYIVQDSMSTTWMPVARTSTGVFVDVNLPASVDYVVSEVSYRFAGYLSRSISAPHFVGAVAFAESQLGLQVVDTYFNSPAMPISSEAPQAAYLLNGVVANALEDMSH